ncbi:MAG: HAMP domain-containing histidine kinase [Chlorobi bacterium]|nr:HAMP domain-containing histidine kinase [Chlorobiota bacterium]
MDKESLIRLTKEQLIEKISVLETKSSEEKDIVRRLSEFYSPALMDKVRTPLSAIMGFADLVTREDIDEDLKRLYMQYLENSSRSLVQTVDDLVDYTLITMGVLNLDLSLFHLDLVFEDLFEELKKQRRIYERLSVALFNLTPPGYSGIEVYADEHRLRQTISRLSGYLLAHSEKGILEIGYEPLNEESIRFFARASRVINARHHYISHNNNRNTGIQGRRKTADPEYLLAHALVQLMDGTFEISPFGKEGIMFSFTLPVTYIIPENIPEVKEEKK